MPRQTGGPTDPATAAITCLKHLKAKAAKICVRQSGEFTVLTVWEPLRNQYLWVFSPESSHILGPCKTRPVLPNLGRHQTWNLGVPWSLPSPYLLYLISVFFPKRPWHQLPAYLHCRHPVLVSCHSHLNYYHDLWAKSNRQVKKGFYIFLMVGEKNRQMTISWHGRIRWNSDLGGGG